MSILDNGRTVLENMDNYIKKQALEEFFYASMLCGLVSVVETDIDPIWKSVSHAWHQNEGSTLFTNKLIEWLDKENHPFNPMMRKNIGRPIYTLDCRHLSKYDALGWLERISEIQKSPKPILVIENITEIPEEDENHDNPQYIQNILLHNWKNPKYEFMNRHTGNNFIITPSDYTVFVTYTPETEQKMKAIWNKCDGFRWIGSVDKEFNKFLKDYKDCTLKELEVKKIVEYE